MTQDEIIRMAREAGIQVTIDWAGRPTMVSIGVNGNVGLTGTEELERFAALVAAHEREACAKVCDEHGFYGAAPARDIRARGEK